MNVNEFKYGLKYYLMNRWVNRIPFWCIRKKLYKAAGMKIGNSIILMNVETDAWEKIIIGDGVCINQYCHLDGRGGLVIEDNASLSIYTKIITGTHDKDSREFAYKSKPVIIKQRVWTGVNSVILPGTTMGEGSVLAAGSVAIGKEYESFKVFSGNPAKLLAERNNLIDYDLSNWTPYFR